jgi:D-lactate dehydrogenase (cytochrome)
LYIKFQGASESAIKEAANIAGKIAKSHGGVNFEMTKTKAEADELWQDRKNALWSGMALLPDSKAWSTDVW